MLQTREYVHLSPRQRLAVLKCLQELAMASETMREHIMLRVEMMTQMRLTNLVGDLLGTQWVHQFALTHSATIHTLVEALLLETSDSSYLSS